MRRLSYWQGILDFNLDDIDDSCDYGPRIPTECESDLAVDVMFESKMAGQYEPVCEEPTMRGIKTVLDVEVLNMRTTDSFSEE